MKKNHYFSLNTIAVLLICLLLANTGYGQSGWKVVRGERPPVDLQNIPEDAYEPGKLLVKLNPEMAGYLPDNRLLQIQKGSLLQTGVTCLDLLNHKFGATRYKPFLYGFYDISPASLQYRQRHEAWGFHLWFEITIDSLVDIKKAVERYANTDAVEIAEPVYKKSIAGLTAPNLHSGDGKNKTKSWTPNDPSFEDQWHYHNTGQYGGTPGADISLIFAWEIEKGHSDVIVAVLDDGIEYNHPDLEGNMWQNSEGHYGYNYVDGTHEIVPGSHGTHVAGTVAAVSNNAIGVAGIAGGTGADDGVRLMSCQILKKTGGTWVLAGSELAPIYAADNGAAITQNSWIYEPGTYQQGGLDAIDYFNANGGGEVLHGGITIAAAGNDNTYLKYYPAAYSGAMAVAATDRFDEKASYSNYGIWIDISAPGGTASGPVLSADLSGTYTGKSGTSMACPHVSGAAALLVSYAHRNGYKLDSDIIWDLLIDNVDDVYELNPDYIGKLGSGRLNAHLALTALANLIENMPKPPASLIATPLEGGHQINLEWVKNPEQDDVMLVWSSDGVFGEPENGVIYMTDAVIPGGGIVLYRGSENEYNHSGLYPATDYYYRAYSFDGENNYSTQRRAGATTLCGAFYLLPFLETFNDTPPAPDCWEIIDHEGNGQVWEFGYYPAYLGYAYLDSEAYGPGNSQNTDLVSPLFDLSEYDDYVAISFKHYFNWKEGSSATLSYSIDDGANWAPIMPWNGTTEYMHTFSQLVPEVDGQSQVRFKWNYTGAYGYIWMVDDVQVFRDPPPQGSICAFAHEITELPFNQTGLTTEGSGNNYNDGNSNTCNTGFMEGEDYLFLFEPEEAIIVDISLSNTEAYTGLFVFDGCPDDPETICVDADYPFDGNPSLEAVFLAGGKSYYIVVSTAAIKTPHTSFDILIEEWEAPPLNMPFIEDFEKGGALPPGWSTEVMAGTANWSFQTGGHNANPAFALMGTYNAFLFSPDTEDDIARLISPVIDVTASPTPVLSFWHAQTAWTGQDELQVLYRTATDAPWTPVPSALWTEEIPSWTLQKVLLPNPSATYQIAFEGNAKAGNGVCIDYVEIKQPNTIGWSGMMGTGWHQNMNWLGNMVPGQTDNVFIEISMMGNYPVIATDESCLNLTVDIGASVTIAPSGTLTVHADLTIEGEDGLIIQSDATGTGSLIVGGAVAGEGTAEIRRFIPEYIENNGWHFLSSPVEAQPIGNEFVDNSVPENPIPGSNDFYKWHEPSNLWINTKAEGGFWNSDFEDDFIVGRGYLVAYETDVTKAFSGKPNQSSGFVFDAATDHPITYTEEGSKGWNLMGNPYPSAIRWDYCIKTNVHGAVYVKDGAGGQYLSWNGTVGGLSGGIIPPMNGFFINAGEDASFTIPNSARLHSESNFYKNAEHVKDLLVLKVEGNGLSDKTYIHFNANATAGFDNDFDAYKLYGVGQAPQFYTSTGNIKLSINVLPYSDDEIVVPLHLEAGKEAEYKISVANNTFWESVSLSLLDLHTEQIYNLRAIDEIRVSHSPATTADRFLVLINGATDVAELAPLDQGIEIYSFEQTIFVQSSENGIMDVTVYNVTGQMVRRDKLPGNENDKHAQIAFAGKTGFYIVVARTQTTIKAKKIFIP